MVEFSLNQCNSPTNQNSQRCSDGVTLTGDGVTQAQLPLVDGEQVLQHCRGQFALKDLAIFVPFIVILLALNIPFKTKKAPVIIFRKGHHH